MGFKQLTPFIDFTRLQEKDTSAELSQFCLQPEVQSGLVAAVCVYPQFVKQVAQSIPTTLKIATVANFPSGENTLADAQQEIAQSIQDGAHEIDVVLPYQRYLAGEREWAIDFISQCKASCGDKVLKVILETGVFPNELMIETAARDVIAAGADFVKTSTGKLTPAATLPASLAILKAIKASDKPVGLKVAGGIRSFEQSMAYFKQAQEVMGQHWPTPQTFRIGCSASWV